MNNNKLEAILEKTSSDNNFDYYTIKLSNNSDKSAYIIYDPAAFELTQKHQRLFCGFSNNEKKTYDAILYNVDHLEISKTFVIPANTQQTIYVKWEAKYRYWTKSLSLLYFQYASTEKFVLNETNGLYLNINF